MYTQKQIESRRVMQTHYMTLDLATRIDNFAATLGIPRNQAINALIIAALGNRKMIEEIKKSVLPSRDAPKVSNQQERQQRLATKDKLPSPQVFTSQATIPGDDSV